MKTFYKIREIGIFLTVAGLGLFVLVLFTYGLAAKVWAFLG